MGTELRSLVIFLASGRTFSFKHVTDFQSNETFVTFAYLSQSAPLVGKRAVFYVTNIAGLASEGV